ncbi:MAG: RecX family transcriptional regulator, partial [Prevotella sp.]|nr:RecX family transcriptional regulator [Prevotella sp.]
QALWLKHIPNDISQRVLDELGIGGGNSRSDDNSEYVQILRELLRNKARSVKAKNAYERNGKLIKFALGRGFSMDVIMKVIEESDEYDFAEDED